MSMANQMESRKMAKVVNIKEEVFRKERSYSQAYDLEKMHKGLCEDIDLKISQLRKEKLIFFFS